MACGQTYIGTSEIYKHVYVYYINGDKTKIKYAGTVNRKTKYFDTEREAALYADKLLIGEGKIPVNILIKK